MSELEIYDDADRRIAIANTTAKTRTVDDIVLAASEEMDGTREDRSGPLISVSSLMILLTDRLTD